MDQPTEHNDDYAMGILDDLIRKYCDKFIRQLNDEKFELKLGELLKMIELRIKHTPSDSDRRKFWEMLENVRKRHLQSGNKEDEAGQHLTSRTTIEQPGDPT